MPSKFSSVVNGVLLADKPLGFTSNQFLQKIKRLFSAKKAGHTGTLDPLATGLLPICFGEATKFSSYMLFANKTYEVVLKLGETTTTLDSEGELCSSKAVPNFSLDNILVVLNAFQGIQSQTPPMYSALKHQGKRLYEIARQGVSIERKSREVHIHSLTLKSFKTPYLSLEVSCSKGTYVRTLVDDIGQKLGCGAHVTSLRRTQTGTFTIQHAYNLEAIERAAADKCLETLILPPETLIEKLPQIRLSALPLEQIKHGQIIRVSDQNIPKNADMALIGPNGQFWGIVESADGEWLKAKRLLAQA